MRRLKFKKKTLSRAAGAPVFFLAGFVTRANRLHDMLFLISLKHNPTVSSGWRYREHTAVNTEFSLSSSKPVFSSDPPVCFHAL